MLYSIHGVRFLFKAVFSFTELYLKQQNSQKQFYHLEQFCLIKRCSYKFIIAVYYCCHVLRNSNPNLNPWRRLFWKQNVSGKMGMMWKMWKINLRCFPTVLVVNIPGLWFHYRISITLPKRFIQRALAFPSLEGEGGVARERAGWRVQNSVTVR